MRSHRALLCHRWSLLRCSSIGSRRRNFFIKVWMDNARQTFGVALKPSLLIPQTRHHSLLFSRAPHPNPPPSPRACCAIASFNPPNRALDAAPLCRVRRGLACFHQHLAPGPTVCGGGCFLCRRLLKSILYIAHVLRAPPRPTPHSAGGLGASQAPTHEGVRLLDLNSTGPGADGDGQHDRSVI